MTQSYGVEMTRNGEWLNTTIPLPGQTQTREQAEAHRHQLVHLLNHEMRPGETFALRVVQIDDAGATVPGGDHGDPVTVGPLDVRPIADLRSGDVYRLAPGEDAEQLVADPAPARGGGTITYAREAVGRPPVRGWSGPGLSVILLSGPSKTAHPSSCECSGTGRVPALGGEDPDQVDNGATVCPGPDAEEALATV